jgi:hypothetical protein
VRRADKSVIECKAGDTAIDKDAARVIDAVMKEYGYLTV